MTQTLELSQEEANILSMILSNVGGSPGGPRGIVDGIIRNIKTTERNPCEMYTGISPHIRDERKHGIYLAEKVHSDIAYTITRVSYNFYRFERLLGVAKTRERAVEMAQKLEPGLCIFYERYEDQSTAYIEVIKHTIIR